MADNVLRSLTDFCKKHIDDEVYCRIGSSAFACLCLRSDGDDRKRVMEDLIEKSAWQTPVPGVRLKCGIYQNVDHTMSVVQMYTRAEGRLPQKCCVVWWSAQSETAAIPTV